MSRRRVIALVVLTCLLFITLDKRGNPVIDRVRGVLATVMRPIDTATRAIALPIERTWYGITNYDDLERERDALRDQVEHQKGNDVEARSAVLEYRLLLKVLQLTSRFNYPTVAAQVVGDAPGNFQNTVQINVGTDKGVQTGMPVTNGAGLVGKITEVFADHSIVRLITDPGYAVSAQVLSAGGESTGDELVNDVTGPDGAGTTTPTPTTTTTTSTTTTTTTTQPPGGSGNPGATTVSPPPAATTSSTLLAVVRETGVLQGQGGNKPMLLRFVDSNSSITSVRIGAIVNTAGGSSGGNESLAPQGIPIGTITGIISQTGDSGSLVEVTPNASLRQLNFVAVVLFLPAGR